MSGFDEPWKQSWAREADKVKALTESLRYTVKERDTWRQRAEEAEECIVWVKCDDPEHERLAALATENQAMRAVVDAARELPNIACLMAPYDYQPCGDCPACHFYAALASLPPVTDERMEA